MAAERRHKSFILILVLILMAGFCGANTWGNVDSRQSIQIFAVPFYSITSKAELCGEPVPLASADVRERFDREFTIITHSHAQVYLWLKRMDRYFPWLEKQLAARGLPDDLKFVAIAESDLLPSAVSQAGAAGPWQFMAPTAQTYGMSQTASVDERYDFEIAAEGAFKYMNKLQNIFQNWTLAIAAYNCGEKRIQDEIRKQRVSTYYLLKLPNETERYIFRILAIKEVLTNPEKYGYYLPKGASYTAIAVEKINLNLPTSLSITDAAEAAGITYREFKILNPWLVSDSIPAGSFIIKVPQGRGREFEKNIEAWKTSRKPQFVLHKVAKGETLDLIARRYKASGQQICDWNQMKTNRVQIGQLLKIYQ